MSGWILLILYCLYGCYSSPSKFHHQMISGKNLQLVFGLTHFWSPDSKQKCGELHPNKQTKSYTLWKIHATALIIWLIHIIHKQVYWFNKNEKTLHIFSLQLLLPKAFYNKKKLFTQIVRSPLNLNWYSANCMYHFSANLIHELRRRTILAQ